MGLAVHLDDGSGRRIAAGVLTALRAVPLGARSGFVFLTYLAAFGDVGFPIATGCGITMIGVGIATLGAGPTATVRIGE